MYVQLLDIYIENIGYFRYFRKFHDIFQPWMVRCALKQLAKLFAHLTTVRAQFCQLKQLAKKITFLVAKIVKNHWGFAPKFQTPLGEHTSIW